MIACVATHPRGRKLFAALHKANERFLDLGVLVPAKQDVILAKLQSFSLNRTRMNADTGFAPAMIAGLEAAGLRRFDGQQGIEHVLCWGAKARPTMAAQRGSYSIITDMCYDADDQRIPAEWRAYKHERRFVAKQWEVFHGARSIFTLSTWAKEQIERLYFGSAQRHIQVIGSGPLNAADDPNFRPQGRPYFLMLGSEWKRKGVATVRSAAGMFLKDRPGIAVAIVGNPGAGYKWQHDAGSEDVFAAIQRDGGILEFPHAVLGGMAAKLIANATALILASSFDPSPHVIAEAHSAGTPVIGSEVCGIPELVNPPVGGLTFPAGDADALAEAMNRVWEHRDALRRGAYDSYVDTRGWGNAAKVIAQSLVPAMEAVKQ